MKTTIPINPFDQFLSSYEEDNVSIDYNNEIRLILVYIGLITVILFVFILIFSLINKCIKIFHDEKITTIKKKHQQFKCKQYQSNHWTYRQNSTSSISSSSLLIKYQPNKPSLAATLRMLQHKEQQLSPIVNV